jgi:hypothetical protein
MYSTKHPDLIESIKFDNRFVRELPEDPETINKRRQVLNSCYSRVKPAIVSSPQLVACSREVAALLGFSKKFCESKIDYLSLIKDI